METREEQYKRYRDEASEDDVHRIDEELPSMRKGILARIWDQVTALWRLARDPQAAWAAKAVAIGALVYVVSPVDAIPDIIPVFGLTDDAAVVAAAVATLGAQLAAYLKKDETAARG